MYYFFDASKQKQKRQKSINEGMSNSYCSISVECQERCHELFIGYNAHAKVNNFFFKENFS